MDYVMLLHAEPYASTALNLSTALQEGARPEDPRLSLPNVQRLGDLYHSAIECRGSGLCDGPTLDANFHSNIEGFYRLTRDDELVRLSCRLGMAPGAYGESLRRYLEETRPPRTAPPQGPVPTLRCA